MLTIIRFAFAALLPAAPTCHTARAAVQRHAVPLLVAPTLPDALTGALIADTLLPLKGLLIESFGRVFNDMIFPLCGGECYSGKDGATVPAALKACNEAMGIEASGPLLAQADELVLQLGISIDTLVPRPPPAAPPAPPSKADLAALDARVAAALQPPPPPPRPREQQTAMPKMVVFDLDFTLWRPELYQLPSGSPFKACSDGAVLTSRGERLDLFPAARTALRTLADAHVPVAIASRANEVAWAHEIMRLLRVDDIRTVADVVGSAPVVIQGGSKVAHLKHIASESGVSLRDMLFFDNERTNIVQVEKIGPTCVYCPRGMTDSLFAEG